MNNKLPNRIPLKELLILNGKLFLAFLFGVLLITSLHDLSFHGIIQRVLAMSTLFIIIFIINVFIFHFFDRRRKSELERVWFKTFFIGYFISFIYYNIHMQFTISMIKEGLYELPRNGVGIEDFTGFQYFTFVLASSLVIYSFIFLVQNAVLTQYEKNQIQLELLKLEASNTDAKNQLLQQQIRPHFLFNALNILKILIHKDSKKADEYLLHLSDFLRISISKNKSGLSTIEDELKICNDYMEMQKIRFGEALNYEINIPELESINSNKLPFFSLQSLLENAIKHNSMTLEKPLNINITKEDNFIKVSNNLQRKSISDETTSGNGLKMLFERYDILNEVQPIIKEDKSTFSIKLKMIR